MLKEHLSCPLPPKVGDEVYLFNAPAGLDLQLNGGKTTVVKIEDFTSGSVALKMITTDVFREMSFNWEDLGREQEDLRKKFGETKASVTPNSDLDFK